MYPISLLNDPPAPTYPQYPAVVALARQLAPTFVDPANLYPEHAVVARRGDDWCIAVLGRPFRWPIRISVHEQWLLIAADRLDVDPPLPGWVVEGRAAQAAADAAWYAARRAQATRDHTAWADALAAATVELRVHANTTARPQYGAAHHLGHAVPTTDVYSGADRRIRTHPAGSALCESPTRAKRLALRPTPEPDGVPATCVRCLAWVPQVRPTRGV